MNTNSLNWSLVQSFLAVIKHGSLTAAANAAEISQPTLGRHISELEQHLKLVLFERTGWKLLPTENALLLAQAAQAMATEAANLSMLASSASSSLQGSVRLTASQPIACFLLPPILAKLHSALPDLTLDLVVTDAVSNLLLREADIALRMFRPEQDSLVSKRIGTVRVRACASKAYLQKRGTPMKPEDLIHHDLIVDSNVDNITAGFERLGYSSKQFRMVARCDDKNAQWACVRAGMGVGFMGDYLLEDDESVVPLLPDLELPTYPIWLTAHRELRTSKRIRSTFDFLAAEFETRFRSHVDG